jgi:hypothetical protein
MSKLAHSNDESMLEIEMNNHGFRSLLVKVKPKCDYVMPEKFYRKKGETCRRYARYSHNLGGLYCKLHAMILAENYDRVTDVGPWEVK